MIDGLRLALTTLTVLPLRPGRVDRSSARVAMALAPLVGALLGLVLTVILAALRAAHLPALAAAGVTIAAAALLTRGLHLDGLADTADAFGSYRRGDAALEVMKKSDIGPFGVAAIALTLLIQAGALTGVDGWRLTAAWGIGRLAVVLACSRPVPAARTQGLGALVAGTVPVGLAALVTLLVAAASAFVVPGRPWAGPAACAAASLTTMLLLWHAVRRFGGLTGDVIGAAVETATTVALLVLAAA